VKGYGSIARPLTNMLKKNSLCWYAKVKVAFHDLKVSLVSALCFTKFFQRICC